MVELPGTWTVEIVEVQPEDMRYLQSQTLADLRTQLSGKDEGYLSRPDGKPHWVSLKQWANRDSHTTRLEVQFKFVPQAPTPSNFPPSSSSLLSSTTRESYIVRHGEIGGSHKVELRPSTPDKTQWIARKLLTLPEVTQADVPCPLCDAIIKLHEPLEPLIRDIAAQFDGDDTYIDVCILHPSNITETESLIASYPFRATRYWEG